MKKTIIFIILFVSTTLFPQEQSIENNQLHQLALKQKNYYNGSIDGIIGQGTKRAITNFQEDNDLPITSELDNVTKELLMKDPRQSHIENLENSLEAGEDVVIHCFVALCCNKCQGIVPVPKFLGKGDDPDGNLYWGA
ncbi:MAG: peptidoglycan-binding domain-containing protein, partial [Candidatus Cloacimonadota bacterium]|nr:peptidoglycan-binding domain-containing protein [Candidatus Cloacimonadota bacterium]